jgi:hypothetical protein
METLTQEQLEKFTKFKAAYDEARVWLIDAGGGPETIARNILNAALREVPMAGTEIELYKDWLRSV